MKNISIRGKVGFNLISIDKKEMVVEVEPIVLDDYGRELVRWPIVRMMAGDTFQLGKLYVEIPTTLEVG